MEKNLKIDKDKILENFEKGIYDLSIHFSKKLAFDMPDVKSKIKSLQVLPTKGKHSKQLLNLFVSFHCNQIN